MKISNLAEMWNFHYVLLIILYPRIDSIFKFHKNYDYVQKYIYEDRFDKKLNNNN